MGSLTKTSLYVSEVVHILVGCRKIFFGKSEKLTRGSRSKYGKTGVCFVEN